VTAFLDHYQDLPEHLRLALADVAGGQVVPVPLFPLGEWKSAKYPSLPLTRELADELIANFEAGVLGTSPVLDSSGNHDTAAPAAGWFKRLHVEPLKDGGEMLFGDAELTDLGASMLNAGLYKYDSVELGPVIDNATGAKTDNVFRSATLTNTPVLRMLPPVLDAADSIAMTEPVEIALSEITLAAIPEFIKAKMRAKWLKANPGKTEDDVPENMKASEDDGSHAEPIDGSSEPASHPEKGDEGHPVTLAEGDAAKEGADSQMKTVIQLLKLSENADEPTIHAAVVKLAEHDAAETKRADTAEAKIAEEAKRVRAAEVDRLLSELVDGAHILPGQKEAWAKLAEDAPASFDVFAANAKKVKAIELGESGSGKASEETSDDPAVELDEAAKKLAEERKVPYGEAMTLALAEDPALAARYHNRNL
jgi:hypothetical protein